MDDYLIETDFLDFNNPLFDKFIDGLHFGDSDKENVLKLYYKVRDGFIYDPYHLDLTYEGLKASNVLKKNRAWCVEKSSVLAALARKIGVPSRLGYAIVTNHIGVEKLTSILKREEIVFHGYVDLYIDDKWVKCTPAFDERICKMTGVSPLDFDGENDSLFQAFEGDQKFMEYRHFYGDFNDVPIQLMNDEMRKYYPHLFEREYNERSFSFRHL